MTKARTVCSYKILFNAFLLEIQPISAPATLKDSAGTPFFGYLLVLCVLHFRPKPKENLG